MTMSSTTLSHETRAKSGSCGRVFTWYSSSTMRGAQISPYRRGSKSSSSIPASVISGVVLVTTGGLSVACLLLRIRLLIEEGHVVLIQQVEKLTPRQAKKLGSFP